MLAGIVKKFSIGLYLSPTRLNRERYLILLELLQDVPIAIRNHQWFRHKGAPMHFSADVNIYLNAAFDARWVGRG